MKDEPTLIEPSMFPRLVVTFRGRVIEDISLKDIFVAVAWFMPIAILAGILLIFFPELAT